MQRAREGQRTQAEHKEEEADPGSLAWRIKYHEETKKNNDGWGG